MTMKAEIISSMHKLLEAEDALTVQKQFKQLTTQFRAILEEEKAKTPPADDSEKNSSTINSDSPGEKVSSEKKEIATSPVAAPDQRVESTKREEKNEPKEEESSVDLSSDDAAPVTSAPSMDSPAEETSTETVIESDSSTEAALLAESSKANTVEADHQIDLAIDPTAQKSQTSPAPPTGESLEEKAMSESTSEHITPENAGVSEKSVEVSNDFIVETTSDDQGKNDNDLKAQFDSLSAEFRKKIGAAREVKLKLESEKVAKARQLLEELQELVEKEENIGKAFSGFNAIQEHWKNLPKVSNDAYRDLNAEYNKVIERFFYNINIYKELKELDLKHNLEQKTLVLEDQKKLMEVEDVRLLEVEVRLNQDRWNAIGPTFKEEWDKIKDEFWSVTRTIYKKVQDVYNKKREEQEENFKAKEALLESVTGILEVEPHTPKKWQELTKEIIAVQEKWKTIGFVPKEKSGPLWKKFRKSCDLFFDKKRKFFGDIHKAHSVNKEAKEKLVKEAEELKVSLDWAKTTSQLIELQKTWKTVGPAHQSDDQALWQRFRSACDHFFQAKNAEHAGEGKRQLENLDNKQKLIEELKAFTPAKEKEKNLEDLKSFSERWRAIGHVPFKDKDEVNKSYKTAMDEKFNALKIDQRSRQMMRFEEKVETFAESSGGERLIKKERDFIRGKISRLESDIKLFENNMGFFANSKGAEKLKEEVVRKIDLAKTELDALYEQLQILQEVQ